MLHSHTFRVYFDSVIIPSNEGCIRMSKEIKPSWQYLTQLTQLREKTRQAMLGLDPESQSELRYVERQIMKKMKEVQKAIGFKQTVVK